MCLKNYILLFVKTSKHDLFNHKYASKCILSFNKKRNYEIPLSLVCGFDCI